jgi:hypothetical protein
MPTITAADNNGLEISLGVEEIKFIDALKTLPDLRDNRGKRHSQVFLIATFVFATLVLLCQIHSLATCDRLA